MVRLDILRYYTMHKKRSISVSHHVDCVGMTNSFTFFQMVDSHELKSPGEWAGKGDRKQSCSLGNVLERKNQKGFSPGWSVVQLWCSHAHCKSFGGEQGSAWAPPYTTSYCVLTVVCHSQHYLFSNLCYTQTGQANLCSPNLSISTITIFIYDITIGKVWLWCSIVISHTVFSNG